MNQNYCIVPDAQCSDAAFADLRARAFAFRSLAPRGADVLRAGSRPISGTVVSAKSGDRLVGYVALWPIHLQTGGARQDLCLLGPLMVDPEMQGAGVGSALMRQVVAKADAKHLPPVLLVGDAVYYHRFGFESGLASSWQMPGLAAPERMLIRSSLTCGLPSTGAVLPAFAPPGEKQAAA